MRQNVYEVEKNVEKIYRGEATGFLTGNTRALVESKFKKNEYKIFRPCPDAEKVILYAGSKPIVRLVKVCFFKRQEIKHSAIMGSLFGLNITSEMFGDIVSYNDEFYIYLLDSIFELVRKELRTIGNVSVKLEEVPLEALSDYKRKYEEIELIVSSLRIDTVVSRLCGVSRDSIIDKIRDKEIFLNDINLKKDNINLKVGDIFSVRRFGKFRFKEVLGRTKKGNFIIVIEKFV